MTHRHASRTLVIGTAAAVFVVCCILPVAYVLAMPLNAGRTALDGLLLDARQRALLFNTTLLGAGTALLATLIGAPLGVILARVPLHRKGLVRLALGAPLLLPPYVVALAWTYFGGSWTFSLPAAVAVLSVVFYPLAMLATEAAMRRIDGRLEEAALTIAPPERVFRRITLPLAAPAITAAALLIFVLAVSEFGVPGLLRVRVYTTEVFTAFAALYDFRRAVLLSVPLLLLCVIVAGIAATVVQERLVGARRASGRAPITLDHWRGRSRLAVLAVFAVALGLPVLVLLREALGARSLAAAVSGSSAAIGNSLMLSVIGATVVTALALWLGYARARATPRAGRAADILFVVLFAVPSTIVGVGLIGLWNRPGPIGDLYGTDAMLVLAYLARLLPAAALVLAASARAVPSSHEEAAAMSGAGWLRTMWRIVLPQMRVGIASAWVMAFVLAFGELGASILVAPPGDATLPIRVYTIIANTPPSHVAALALLQTLIAVAPLAVLGLVASAAEAR